MTARLFAALLLIVVWTPARADDPSPKTVVETFQASLIGVMKEADRLGVKGRFARLAPIIDATFHVPLMTQIAAASHWAKADAEQRQTLVKAFKRMSVSTLATLFDGYDGERFDITGEAPGPQGTLLVKTLLVKKDRSTHDIAYVAKRLRDRWYIIDVIVDEGISELTVRRSEYRRILDGKGVPGLIDVLNAKADELLAQKSAK